MHMSDVQPSAGTRIRRRDLSHPLSPSLPGADRPVGEPVTGRGGGLGGFSREQISKSDRWGSKQPGERIFPSASRDEKILIHGTRWASHPPGCASSWPTMSAQCCYLSKMLTTKKGASPDPATRSSGVCNRHSNITHSGPYCVPPVCTTTMPKKTPPLTSAQARVSREGPPWGAGDGVLGGGAGRHEIC